jgi:hypothetical protein
MNEFGKIKTLFLFKFPKKKILSLLLEQDQISGGEVVVAPVLDRRSDFRQRELVEVGELTGHVIIDNRLLKMSDKLK